MVFLMNLQIRPDSDNDIKNALALLRTLWNRHYEKSQGQLVYGFVKHNPQWAENVLQEGVRDNTMVETLNDFAKRFNSLENLVTAKVGGVVDQEMLSFCIEISNILGIPDEKLKRTSL